MEEQGLKRSPLRAGSLKVKNPVAGGKPAEGAPMDTIGEDSNTSSDKRCSTVLFPAGNGNFGMRLSLDVLTAGEDRVRKTWSSAR